MPRYNGSGAGKTAVYMATASRREGKKERPVMIPFRRDPIATAQRRREKMGHW